MQPKREHMGINGHYDGKKSRISHAVISGALEKIVHGTESGDTGQEDQNGRTSRLSLSGIIKASQHLNRRR